MNAYLGALIAIPMMVVLGACGGDQANPSGMKKGAKHKIRVIVKKVGGNCISRTFPKHDELWVEDEDEFVWTIKQKNQNQDKCLEGRDVVIKWQDNRNPSECDEVSTKTNGNKSEIKCGLKAGTTSGNFRYKLYSRPENATDSSRDVPLEDPDVEIVTF